MTRKGIRDDLLRRVWVDDPANAPDYVLADAATAVNQALQMLWLLPGLDFFRRAEVEVELEAGTNRYELAATIQAVLDVSRLNGSPLRPVRTRGDIEHYRRRFTGATAESSGTPEAYWVERLASNAAGDAADTFLWVAPTPSGTGTLTIEASTEAPNYSAAQMADDANGIAMPHQYVESLLLPVARYLMTRSHWFIDAQREDALKADAEAAFRSLGLAVPWAEAIPGGGGSAK